MTKDEIEQLKRDGAVDRLRARVVYELQRTTPMYTQVSHFSCLGEVLTTVRTLLDALQEMGEANQ